jgi:C1A family cysteine protease
VTVTVNGQERGLGWIPDLPDIRDHDTPTPMVIELPDHVRLDLDPAMPPVYDQLRLGSCTANALASAIEFDVRRQGLTDFMPSRLFIYFCERVLEHSVAWDAGAMIRDGAKVLHKIGVPHETTWPYDISRFTEKPPPEAYAEAKNTKAVSYGRVSRYAMKNVLASGTPFVVGFSVYSNFYRIGDDGMMSMPEGDLIGGHAVKACGYDTIDRNGTGDPFPGGLCYRVRNSWNVDWADGGYFWMPAPYLQSTRLSSDFWAIRTVS